jgi:hypothetical protein
MSGGMPYYVEKGPMLTLLETYFNRPWPGKHRLLQRLRTAEQSPQSVDWVTTVLPEVWHDPAMAKAPGAASPAEHVIKHWFGYGQQAGRWVPGGGQSTGFWIGYQGDVNAIVRRGLRWALEVSLGLMPGEEGPGRADPDPIEFVWICNAYWFETWVLQRPTTHGGRLVSVVFITPPHTGGLVAKSPIATSAKVMPPGGSNAVPSLQDHYELVGGAPVPPATRPRAVDRPYATWVVTHDHHLGPGDPPDNTAPAPVGGGSVHHVDYRGEGGPVIVSPSYPAGGVPYDHWIRP